MPFSCPADALCQLLTRADTLEIQELELGLTGSLALIMPGSRVRVPPFPPLNQALAKPLVRTIATAGDLRDASSHTFSDAAIRLPISAAE